MHALLREVAERAILPRYQKLAAHEIDGQGGRRRRHRRRPARPRRCCRRAGADLPEPADRRRGSRASPIRRCWTGSSGDLLDRRSARRHPQLRRGQAAVRHPGRAGRGRRGAYAGWIYDPPDAAASAIAHARQGRVRRRRADRARGRPAQTPPVAAISLIFMDPAQREAVEARDRAALRAGRHPALRRRAISAPRAGRERRRRSSSARCRGTTPPACLFAQRGRRQGRAARRLALPRRRAGRTGLIGAASPRCGTSWPSGWPIGYRPAT